MAIRNAHGIPCPFPVISVEEGLENVVDVPAGKLLDWIASQLSDKEGCISDSDPSCSKEYDQVSRSAGCVELETDNTLKLGQLASIPPA